MSGIFIFYGTMCVNAKMIMERNGGCEVVSTFN